MSIFRFKMSQQVEHSSVDPSNQSHYTAGRSKGARFFFHLLFCISRISSSHQPFFFFFFTLKRLRLFVNRRGGRSLSPEPLQVPPPRSCRGMHRPRHRPGCGAGRGARAGGGTGGGAGRAGREGGRAGGPRRRRRPRPSPRSAATRIRSSPGRRHDGPRHVCGHETEVRPVPAREELHDRALGQARGQDRREPELHRTRWVWAAGGPRCSPGPGAAAVPAAGEASGERVWGR